MFPLAVICGDLLQQFAYTKTIDIYPMLLPQLTAHCLTHPVFHPFANPQSNREREHNLLKQVQKPPDGRQSQQS